MSLSAAEERQSAATAPVASGNSCSHTLVCVALLSKLKEGSMNSFNLFAIGNMVSRVEVIADGKTQLAQVFAGWL
jgi:hypothetical protein